MKKENFSRLKTKFPCSYKEKNRQWHGKYVYLGSEKYCESTFCPPCPHIELNLGFYFKKKQYGENLNFTIWEDGKED